LSSFPDRLFAIDGVAGSIGWRFISIGRRIMAGRAGGRP